MKKQLITDVIMCVFFDETFFSKRENAIVYVGFYIVLSYPNAKWQLNYSEVKFLGNMHHQNDIADIGYSGM